MNFKDDIERQVWETTIADSWGFVNPDDGRQAINGGKAGTNFLIDLESSKIIGGRIGCP